MNTEPSMELKPSWQEKHPLTAVPSIGAKKLPQNQTGM
jgi:hypothetical protein